MDANPIEELEILRTVQTEQLRALLAAGLFADVKPESPAPVEATELDLRRCADEILEPHLDRLSELTAMAMSSRVYRTLEGVTFSVDRPQLRHILVELRRRHRAAGSGMAEWAWSLSEQDEDVYYELSEATLLMLLADLRQAADR